MLHSQVLDGASTLVIGCSAELYRTQAWWTVSSSGHFTPEVPLTLACPGDLSVLPTPEVKGLMMTCFILYRP